MKKFNFDIKAKPVSEFEDNWFYYWKYSPSLWREELAKFKRQDVVFVPLNWKWHHTSEAQVDFGDKNADRDLKKIQDFGLDLNLEIVFLFPVSPCPFIANGGAPDFLSLSLARNRHNMNITFLDHSHEIYHQVSFFDPEVYKAYNNFVLKFNDYQKISKLKSACLAEYKIVSNSEVRHLFEDFSVHFDQGFARFIKKQEILNKQDQSSWEQTYRQEIRNLYFQTATDSIEDKQDHKMTFSVLGAGTEHVFMRSFSQDTTRSGYFLDSLISMESECFPITSMLFETEKKSGIQCFLKEVMDQSFIFNNMNKTPSTDQDQSFSPLKLFTLFGLSFKTWKNWNDINLTKTLRDDYPWLMTLKSHDDLELDDKADTQAFIFGGKIPESTFHKIINLFLMGSDIFIDTADLDPDTLRKIEIFILENELKVDHVKFIAPIRKAYLPAGSFYLFSSNDLKDISKKETSNFWNRLLGDLSIKYLDTIIKDDQVHLYWQKRSVNPHELSYQEIRRLMLFNPTEETKTVKIGHHKNYAFLKTPINKKSKLTSNKSGLEISINPKGHITLDFGYFEGGISERH